MDHQSLSSVLGRANVSSPVKDEDEHIMSDSDQVYPIYDSDSSLLMTPDANQVGDKVNDLQLESATSGGANSSDLSIKEGSRSSLSLSDSDSESINSTNAYYSLPRNSSRKVLSGKKPTYEELVEKVAMYEEEMKASNLRLEKSEEEVSWLKSELRKGAEAFQSRLESAHREIKVKEGSWQLLQNQLKLAGEEMEALKAELASERVRVMELEEQNSSHERHEIQLEQKLTQCEAEKKEMMTLHEAQATKFRHENSRLEANTNIIGEELQGLNKKFDTLKLKYDELATERDEKNAKLETLSAEIRNQEIQKREMEEHLRRVNLENGDLIAKSGSAEKLAEELRSRVVELEKEVDRQSGEVSAMAEEKREAIRQLCLSLEHYRSDYRELREAIVGQKRVRVVA